MGSITPVSQPRLATASLSQVPSAAHRSGFKLLLGPLGLGTDPARPAPALSPSCLAQGGAFPSAELGPSCSGKGHLLFRRTAPAQELPPSRPLCPTVTHTYSCAGRTTMVHNQPSVSRGRWKRASLSHPQGSSRRRLGLPSAPPGEVEMCSSDPTS